MKNDTDAAKTETKRRNIRDLHRPPPPLPDKPTLELTVADQKALKTFRARAHDITDAVAAVVHGRATGCYIWGPPGTGKSHTVMSALRAEGHTRPKHHKSKLTGRALFDELSKHPNSIHLIEDCENMLTDRNAIGPLLAALHGDPSPDVPGLIERRITWGVFAKNAPEPFVFCGGIIMVFNRALPPEFAAVGSRIVVAKHDPTPDELRAVIIDSALTGVRLDNGEWIKPPESIEVGEFLVREIDRTEARFDLRTIATAFGAYAQWRENESSQHWRDLIRGRLAQRTMPTLTADVRPGSKKERMRADRDLVWRCHIANPDSYAAALAQWQDSAHDQARSEATFKRRLRQARDERGITGQGEAY